MANSADYAYQLRQNFITGTGWLADRVQQLRNNSHAAGKALIGEEEAAKRSGLKRFDANGKYRRTK